MAVGDQLRGIESRADTFLLRFQGQLDPRPDFRVPLLDDGDGIVLGSSCRGGQKNQHHAENGFDTPIHGIPPIEKTRRDARPRTPEAT